MDLNFLLSMAVAWLAIDAVSDAFCIALAFSCVVIIKKMVKGGGYFG